MPASPGSAAELAIIVPTFNEAANVGVLYGLLAQTLADGPAWEVIFVDDDSPDGTAETVRELGKLHPNIRCLSRIGRRGLSSAVVEGCLATSAPSIAVMDADLQHDERILPDMLRRLEAGHDLAVGTRYAAGGGTGEWSRSRIRLSRLATRLTKAILRVSLSDPMSGFFMIRRQAFLGSVHGVSATGYKILLDILSSAPAPLKIAEIPYVFRPRQAGESKMDTLVLVECAALLVDKAFGGLVPVRFILYSGMGSIGILVHLAALFFAGGPLGLSFARAQAAAIFTAMIFNFAANNQLTYRDRRLRGGRIWRGLAVYLLICSIGAISNLSVSLQMFALTGNRVVAGGFGAFIGAVFNYSLATQYVWSRRILRRKPAR